VLSRIITYQLNINHPVFSRVSLEGNYEPDPTILQKAMNFFSNYCHRLRTLQIVFPLPIVKERCDPDAPVSDVARSELVVVVLCCVELSCVVLGCSELCCIVLCCVVLLCCIVLCCAVLYCVVGVAANT